jgi:excisionase family DNA binding protein
VRACRSLTWPRAHSELGESLLPVINVITKAKYGLEITAFVIENVSVPQEVEQAIDKRSSMSAVGNLNDYVKFQMANSMTQPGGPASVGGDIAVGMAMANQLVQQGLLNPQQNQAAPKPAAAQPQQPATPGIDLLSPGDVANILKVSEGDVISTIESGELKAKKIGSTYRITRAALDEFFSK